MIFVTNDRIPDHIYRQLREQSGLSPKTEAAAAKGLRHTLHFVSVKNGVDEYIGMGRVTGDGGTFCQVTDICVLPAWQGKGIGKMIMENIMQYVRDQLPESCYISLMADGEAYKLYEQFGFRDTLPRSKGMYFLR